MPPSSTTAPPRRPSPGSPGDALPVECVEIILRHLSAVTDGDPREILRAGEVNKSWHAAADRPATYAHMLRARYDVSDLSSPFTFPNHGDLPPGDPRRVEDAWLEMEFLDVFRARRFDELRARRARDERHCFRQWHAAYGDMDPPLFRRVKRAWDAVEAAVPPAVLRTMLPGVSRRRCDDAARRFDDALPGMHPALSALYRYRGGQALSGRTGDPNDPRQREEFTLGVFGGHSFYGKAPVTRFLSFAHALNASTSLARECRDREAMTSGGVVTRSDGTLGYSETTPRYAPVPSEYKYMLRIACDAWAEPAFCVGADVRTGKPYVHRGLAGAGPYGMGYAPAAPPGETVVEWLEEYARRVSAGVYRVEDMHRLGPVMWRAPRAAAENANVVTPFSSDEARAAAEAAPETTVWEHTTRGVRVRVSTVCLISSREALAHMGGADVSYTYSVNLALLSEEEQRVAGDPAPILRAQLATRRWVIHRPRGEEEVEAGSPRGEESEVVEGPGVIGEHPALTAGGPAFEYQSLVAFEGPNAEGRMEGSFEFVPGTIARPEGEPFRVTVPEFRCRPAAYFY